MEQIYTEELSNGNTIKYKERSGMYFHLDTNENIVFDILEAWTYGTRLKIHLGDIKTGKAWGDVEVGYIGRSTGLIKIPLVIYNKRSMGGGALLDNCIVKIEPANKKWGSTIYEHPNFHM